MTRLEALRRLAMVSPATCKRMDRFAGDDSDLAAMLNDPAALASHLMGGSRLTRDEVDRLVAALVTCTGEAPPATEAQILDVRMVAAYA